MKTRHEYDRYANNPDNLVVDEYHKLDRGSQYSIIMPTYALFYKAGFRIYDDVTDTLLEEGEGKDYRFIAYAEYVSGKTGHEAYAMLVVDNEVCDATAVRLRYQTVGGNYVNDSGNLKTLYEAIMNDDRLVPFIHVIDKPASYPPTLHEHMLSDLYGFGPIISALERVVKAIELGHLHTYDALLRYIDDALKSKTFTPLPLFDEVVADGGIVNSNAFFYDRYKVYPQVSDKYFYLHPKEAFVKNGVYTMTFKLEGVYKKSTYMWSIYNMTTTDGDFVSTFGLVDGGEVTLVFTNKHAFEGRIFKVLVHETSVENYPHTATPIPIVASHYLEDVVCDITPEILFGCDSTGCDDVNFFFND